MYVEKKKILCLIKNDRVTLKSTVGSTNLNKRPANLLVSLPPTVNSNYIDKGQVNNLCLEICDNRWLNHKQKRYKGVINRHQTYISILNRRSAVKSPDTTSKYLRIFAQVYERPAMSTLVVYGQQIITLLGGVGQGYNRRTLYAKNGRVECRHNKNARAKNRRFRKFPLRRVCNVLILVSNMMKKTQINSLARVIST